MRSGSDPLGGGPSFFFSSRRRHTSCLSDWSSDVCSSDLGDRPPLGPGAGGSHPDPDFADHVHDARDRAARGPRHRPDRLRHHHRPDRGPPTHRDPLAPVEPLGPRARAAQGLGTARGARLSVATLLEVRSDKKRLEIARALATEPRLLLLDEAMSGLTPAETAAAVELVRRIHGELGLALCVVEHVMEVVMPLSQRVVVLDDGEKIAEGPPAEVVRNDAVIKAYLGEHYRGRR